MEDFLSFRKMITPMIIQILFWIGILFCVIGGLVLISQGIALQGILMLLLGPIGVRVYTELIMVTFKILDALNEISVNTARPAGSASGQLPPTTM